MYGGAGAGARAIASDIVGYQAVWISTQRLRGSENGKNLFFCYGNRNGERDRENFVLSFSVSLCRFESLAKPLSLPFSEPLSLCVANRPDKIARTQ
jgi:hypothetical protein